MTEESPQAIDAVIISERINGWWVSVRYASGHEEHHGPYLDEDSAQSEAALIDPRLLGSDPDAWDGAWSVTAE
jgi:hypothetical protein